MQSIEILSVDYRFQNGRIPGGPDIPGGGPPLIMPGGGGLIPIGGTGPLIPGGGMPRPIPGCIICGGGAPTPRAGPVRPGVGPAACEGMPRPAARPTPGPPDAPGRGTRAIPSSAGGGPSTVIDTSDSPLNKLRSVNPPGHLTAKRSWKQDSID